MFDLSTISVFNNSRTSSLDTYIHSPAGHGGMSKGQRGFHESQDLLRILIGGNQIGKTRVLAAECWFHALGEHPYRKTPPPGSLGWILCADLRSGWANISAKLKEIEPLGAVDDNCTYDPARGYRYRGSMMIRLTNGSLIVGKGSEQSVMALAGATIDWLAIDETPKQIHFGEIRSRTAVNEAPIFMGFTPIGRPVEYLRDIVEGNPETGQPALEDWDVHRIKLSHENCPHRSLASIERQIRGYGPWEYKQRVEGAWEGITTERWIAFSEENVFSEIPENVTELGLGWDHGERPGNSVCYLVGWDGDRLWVLDEYVSTERNTPAAEAKIVAQMIRAWGIDLHQIEVAYGDSNSAGRLGLGFSVNELLERGFATVAGTKRPPFRIGVPYKGAGSIKARARILSNACIDGRFRVNQTCTKLISSLRHWRGENSDYKHPYDAVSYISEHWLGGDSLDNVSKLLL